MKKIITSLVGLLLCSPAAYAEEPSKQELLERIERLESQIENQNEVSLPEWFDRITLSGLVEVEASYVNTDPAGDSSTDESDVVLATVELGIDADIHKHVSAHILFLWEEDDTEPVDIDEAFITIHGKDVLPAYLTAGKLYVPFGNFETHMISDPLTLEIAETNESAIQVGVESNGFYGSVFVFNGDVDEAGEDDSHIENFGANAGYLMESDSFSLDVGFSYINNLVDADFWEDVIDDEGLTLNEYVSGMGAYAIFNMGPVTLIAEYISALDDIEWFDTTNTLVDEDQISAWNIEAGYAFVIGSRETTVALAFQGTDEAQNRLPETRYIGSIGIELFKYTSLALEYYHDEFENDDEEDAITAQLAIEF